MAGAARLARAFAFALALGCAFGAAAGTNADADAALVIATDKDGKANSSKKNETQSADGQTATWCELHVFSLKQSNQHILCNIYQCIQSRCEQIQHKQPALVLSCIFHTNDIIYTPDSHWL